MTRPDESKGCMFWGGLHMCVSFVLHLINYLKLISHALNARNWAGTAVKVLECPSDSITVLQ